MKERKLSWFPKKVPPFNAFLGSTQKKIIPQYLLSTSKSEITLIGCQLSLNFKNFLELNFTLFPNQIFFAAEIHQTTQLPQPSTAGVNFLTIELSYCAGALVKFTVV